MGPARWTLNFAGFKLPARSLATQSVAVMVTTGLGPASRTVIFTGSDTAAAPPLSDARAVKL